MSALQDEIRAAVAEAIAPLLYEIRELRHSLRLETLTIEQVGVMLNRKPGAMRQFLLRNPTFPRRKVGRKLIFDRRAIEDWLEQTGRLKP